MKKLIILSILMLTPLTVSAENLSGRFDELVMNENLIILDGHRISANLENTQIYYRGENVGIEGLSEGDDVTLIFNEELNDQGKQELARIIVERTNSPGMDS